MRRWETLPKIALLTALPGLENYALRIFSLCGWSSDATRDLIKRVLVENKKYGKHTYGRA